jgi:hypothetical protein
MSGLHLVPNEAPTGEIIACTDIGCWFPNSETWKEFLARKGEREGTTLDVDGEILFGSKGDE